MEIGFFFWPYDVALVRAMAAADRFGYAMIGIADTPGARRTLREQLGLVCLTVSFASCSGRSQSASFASSACPQTPEPVPALATARCGVLVVPENRAQPSGRTIRLAVAIIPAVSPTPAPIVYMAGGLAWTPSGRRRPCSSTPV